MIKKEKKRKEQLDMYNHQTKLLGPESFITYLLDTQLVVLDEGSPPPLPFTDLLLALCWLHRRTGLFVLWRMDELDGKLHLRRWKWKRRMMKFGQLLRI